MKINLGRNLSLAQPARKGAIGDDELECGAKLVLAEARSERVQDVVVRRIATLQPTATRSTKYPG
eukprot:9406986-Pyramimonas_sp.AAC.1